MKHYIVFLFLFITIYISAQDNESIYKTEEIVVTGTRIQTLRKHLPLTISVITSDEIKNSIKPEVFTLLEDKVPGLFVTERANLGFGLAQGSAGQVSIRGIGSNPNTQILILLDGRPQFMGLFGHPLPDNYISANVDKVEVVRGPCSFLYGTNAMAGVINLITKRSMKDGISVNINQSYGSFATLIGDAGIGYRKKSLDVYVSASYQKSNGNRPYSSFNLNNGFFKGGYTISKSNDFTIDANLTSFKTYDPGTISSPKIDNWVDILRGDAGFTLDNKFKISEGSLRFLYNYGEHKIYDGFHSKDRNVSINIYQTLKIFHNNTISVGLDFKNYGGEAKNDKSVFDFGSHSINEYAGYLHFQQTLFEKISFNGGLRYEHNSQFGGEIVPQAGIAYELIPELTARFNVSKGFRSPTIRELFLFPAPTPNLQPERLWNYEAGLVYIYSKYLSIEPVVFIEQCENIIVTTGMFPNFKLSNSGSFTKKGFEVALNVNHYSGLSISSGYSYIDNGSQTMGNFKQKLYINSNIRYGIVRACVSLQHISGLYAANDSKMKLPDYALLNASVSVSPFNEISVYVSGENLTNRQYQTVYDYPMPGRTYTAGLKFNY